MKTISTVDASAPTSFDYSTLDAETAKEAKKGASRIRAQIGHQVRSIVEVGSILLDIKSRMDHGLFTRWVELALSCTLRTAENYMHAAQLCGGKSETISHLSPRAVYALAAPSTPNEVRERVMTALASGQDIDSQAIEGQIRLARRDNASNKANTLTVSGSRTRQSEALEAIAAILQYGLDEHAYRKICEIITSADVLGNPTTLVRYLKITFAPLPTKVSAPSSRC